MVTKNKIAIIPARGGSKRIPQKNIIDFRGLPMIAHTIKAAVDSGEFDKIIVSTDDPTIADVSIKYGAEVPFLREKHNDDHSPVSLATIETLKQLESLNNCTYKTVVQLMANCPLRNITDIQEACRYFDANDHHFQISCFKYGWMNPWWAHKLDADNLASPIFDDDRRNQRSQDQPELYCPTGATWIANAIELKKANTFYGESYRFYPMSWKHALDIDNYEDLEMGKMFAQ